MGVSALVGSPAVLLRVGRRIPRLDLKLAELNDRRTSHLRVRGARHSHFLRGHGRRGSAGVRKTVDQAALEADSELHGGQMLPASFLVIFIPHFRLKLSSNSKIIFLLINKTLKNQEDNMQTAPVLLMSDSKLQRV